MLQFEGSKCFITCRYLMEPNQPPSSYVNLLTGDNGEGDMSNSSNISLNPPPNWPYYTQYSSQYHPQQPYPPPQYPSPYPPAQNLSQYPPAQNPGQYPPPQNPTYMYGTPPIYYPTQPPPTTCLLYTSPSPRD